MKTQLSLIRNRYGKNQAFLIVLEFFLGPYRKVAIAGTLCMILYFNILHYYLISNIAGGSCKITAPPGVPSGMKKTATPCTHTGDYCLDLYGEKIYQGRKTSLAGGKR